jgi:hypothetical protein
MRNSKRIKDLELQVVVLQQDIEMIASILQILIDDGVDLPDIESGKWYKKNN